MINVNFVGSVKKQVFSVHAFSNLILGLFYAGALIQQIFKKLQIIRNIEEYATFDLYGYLIKVNLKGFKVRDNDIIILLPFLSTIEIDSAVFRRYLKQKQMRQ